MKKVVVFTGAGVSRDSGIATFRDSDGLWANYRIEDVCTPEALASNRGQVVEFYNKRRKELLEKEPNAGHYSLKELEKKYDVEVVTQNIDNLHERAGNSKVCHLHGELMKLRSTNNPNLIVPIEGWEQDIEARAEDGSLLRPFVVFFGEDVPMFSKAAEIVSGADILVIVGTSLNVYPAASLVQYIRGDVPVYLVDPNPPAMVRMRNELFVVAENSVTGLPKVVDMLMAGE